MTDERMKSYATENQWRVYLAVQEHGTKADAARSLGVSRSALRASYNLLMKKAAADGYSPEAGLKAQMPANQYMRGVTLAGKVDGDGKFHTGYAWLKGAERKESIIVERLESFEYTPAPAVRAPREKLDKDLLSLYTLTDFHLGMYSWAGETGADWDTEIASQVLMSAITEMYERSPKSETAIFNLQGDFTHWDGLDAVTPTSGHVLDADTRFGRLVDVSLDLPVWVIEKLLGKHKNVYVIICEGNHDLAGSVWLRKHLKKMMAKNKRVTVDDSEFPYYAYLHGETMLGFHHGHKKKNKDLPSLFSSEPRYRGMWGKANYCYIHTGHYHHAEQDMAEHGGSIVERHPTLAAPDSYAVRGGYVSRRAARMIVYHATDGEVSRYTTLPKEG